jgi:hypothetical protein
MAINMPGIAIIKSHGVAMLPAARAIIVVEEISPVPVSRSG